MKIVFESERIGAMFRGVVVDMDTFQVVARTTNYASQETARSAAASLWRAKQLEQSKQAVPS